MQNSAQTTINMRGLYYLSVLLLLWYGFTFRGVNSAIQIWSISEVFNHCFIVIPASLYLIWEKRKSIDWQQVKVTSTTLPFLILLVGLYLFGLAGDIQIFMHIAAFTMLPVIVWTALGNVVSKQILFPLAFILFCIPVGEELVPFLQTITADFSVMLLEISGIPLYRSGLYIEIPQGKFLVAEACSGVSFLIASIVLGNLYAYMNLRRKRTKLLFVLLSIVFPIIANVIRVYGIIMIGYWSDMEHAVGADHLIYGWFFFAFVLICLFFIGETIRKQEFKRFSSFDECIKEDSNLVQDEVRNKPFLSTLRVVLPLLLLFFAITKSLSMLSPHIDNQSQPQLVFTHEYDISSLHLSATPWRPEFRNTASEKRAQLQSKGTIFALYVGLYNAGKGELISSQNRLYVQERWSIAAATTQLISDDVTVNQHYIASNQGDYQRIYYVYIINGTAFSSKIRAKLFQTWQILMGNHGHSAILAVGFDGNNNQNLSEQEREIFANLYANVAKLTQ